MEFECDSCHYKSFYRQNVCRHTKRHNACRYAKINTIPNTIRCIICSKIYTHKLTYDIHFKKCKFAADNATVINNVANNVVDVRQLEEELGIVSVPRLSYRNTNYDYIDSSDFKKAISKMAGMIPYLVNLIHFNTSHLENHNIYISSQRGDFIHVYEDGDWKTEASKFFLTDIFDHFLNLIEKYVKSEALNPRWEDLNQAFELRKEEALSMKRDIKLEIKLMLYNKRKMVMPQQ